MLNDDKGREINLARVFIFLEKCQKQGLATNSYPVITTWSQIEYDDSFEDGDIYTQSLDIMARIDFFLKGKFFACLLEEEALLIAEGFKLKKAEDLNSLRYFAENTKRVLKKAGATKEMETCFANLPKTLALKLLCGTTFMTFKGENKYEDLCRRGLFYPSLYLLPYGTHLSGVKTTNRFGAPNSEFFHDLQINTMMACKEADLRQHVDLAAVFGNSYQFADGKTSWEEISRIAKNRVAIEMEEEEEE